MAPVKVSLPPSALKNAAIAFAAVLNALATFSTTGTSATRIGVNIEPREFFISRALVESWSRLFLAWLVSMFPIASE